MRIYGIQRCVLPVTKSCPRGFILDIKQSPVSTALDGIITNHLISDINKSTYIPKSRSASEGECTSSSARSSDCNEICVIRGNKNFCLARWKPNRSSQGRSILEFCTMLCRVHPVRQLIEPECSERIFRKKTKLQDHPRAAK